MVASDDDKVFLSRKLQAVLQKNGIDFKPALSPDVEAAVAERYMRSIKERFWRYFTHNNKRRYVDVLQDLVQSYLTTATTVLLK